MEFQPLGVVTMELRSEAPCFLVLPLTVVRALVEAGDLPCKQLAHAVTRPIALEPFFTGPWTAGCKETNGTEQLLLVPLRRTRR